MIGKTFGDYRVLEKRGEGGMGMFFKALDVRLDRIVGLKTLHADLVSDPSLLERLQTEAKSLARLDHQNIARLLHYLVVGDQHFIVMEFVDGRDLAETIRESGLPPFDRLASISDQVCAAISYAHEQGVVHRDLKPSNILVRPDGRIKVTDFGIAKILGTSSQTRTGTATGSLPYMAPEQIRAGQVDGRTDIYQLGIMLYELTVGRRPFVSDSEYDMMTMHLEAQPAAPSTVNGRVSPAMDAVILRALAKSPDDRFQTAEEMNRALQPALAQGVADTGTRFELPPKAAPPALKGAVDNDKTMMPARPVPPTPPPTPPPPTPKRTPSPPPGRGHDTHHDAEPEGGPKVWPWIAGAAVVVAVILAYTLWPKGGAPPKHEPAPAPDTARVVLPPPRTEPVPISLRANLPAGIPRDRVKTITLEVVHPDSGVSLDTVPAVGGQIQTDFNVAPTDSIRMTLRGFDATSKVLFNGTVVRSAPAGNRLFVDVPLKAVANVLPPEADRPPKQVNDTVTSANLVINVTPFSERDRIDRVWLDDRPISGSFPIRLRVDSGRHKLRWQIGANRWTDTVTVAAQGTAVEKDLFVGTGFGRVTVSATLAGSSGYADIWLDGVSTGLGTPGRLESVLTGPHEVAVKSDSYQMRGGPQMIQVRASSDTLLRFEMVPK